MLRWSQQTFPGADRLAHQRDPVIFAGGDRTAVVGGTVVVDHAVTVDWEDDPLTVHWEITEAPAGSRAVLEGAASLSPGLTPDRVGRCRLCATVHDGLLESVPDCLDILATGIRRPAGRVGRSLP